MYCLPSREVITLADLTVRFTKEKDTKNAVRFQEDVADGRDRGVVGTLYVLKADLDTIGNPASIEVTIKGV